MAIAFIPSVTRAECVENWGDVTADGSVDVADAECLILTSLLAMNPGFAAPACLAIGSSGADVSCDEAWTLLDTQLVIHKALGLALPPAIDMSDDDCPDRCQATCGDLACAEAYGETCDTCPFDCGVCPDSCCIDHPQPGCNNAAVQACVCGITDFCCNFFWDASCVEIAEEYCAAQCFVPACAIQDLLVCGQTVNGTTVGGASAVTTYGCTGSSNLTGPEKYFAFKPKGSYPAKATLSGLGTQNLDVFVLGDNCEAGNCVGKGNTEVQFEAKAGETHYIAVDGVSGAQGPFALTLTCADDCNTAALCGAKQCGTASCKGFPISCGTCAANLICDVSGTCVEPSVSGCPGPGDCYVATGTIGCNDAACCSIVCADDPFCCSSSWDSICAGNAAELCNNPCGDGICTAADGEDCSSCKADCGCAAGSECVAGACVACNQEAVCSAVDCGSVSCGGQGFDCGGCPAGKTCGNNICYQCGDGQCALDAGESCENCAADCACEAPKLCISGECIGADLCDLPAVVSTIGCNQTVNGNNGDGSSAMGEYNCVSWAETGPEMIYAFTPPADTTIEVEVETFGQDLDLFILGPSCTNESCLEYGSMAITADVTGGETYYVVVDGYQGDVDNFALSLACESLCTPELACAAAECGAVTCFGNTFDCGTCDAGFTCGAGNNCIPCGDGICDKGAGEGCLTCKADCGCSGSDVCGADGTCQAASTCAGKATPITCGSVVSANNGSGSSSISTYNCVGWNESGPEQVYEFTATSNSEVAYVMESDLDLDVFVLAGTCSDKSCVAYASSEGSFVTTAGVTYYIVVDGYNGNVDDFTLSVQCADQCNPDVLCADKECGPVECFGTTFDCGTCGAGAQCGTDNVCYTCGDGKCSSAGGEGCNTCAADCPCGPGVVCTAEGTCEQATSCQLPAVVQQLECTTSVSGNNSGGASVISAYNCVGWNESGPEVVYAFSPKSDTGVDIQLGGVTADLDIFVLSGSCNDKACIAYGSTGVTFDAVAGELYFIVVDGYNGAKSSFTLDILCSAESCSLDALCGTSACGTIDCIGQLFDCGACAAGQFCVDNACSATNPFPACTNATGGCNAAKTTPGCSDANCCIAVCSIDSFCCNNSWDSICVGEAADLCP